jgi:SNW domain-containing protein 1
MKGNFRKNKMERDAGRDVSEKIALGMLKGGVGQLSGEALFDSRLFNQSSGMDAGFGAEDEYGVYSKPLFERGAVSSVYRPKRDDSEAYGDSDAILTKLKNTSKFQPDKGFQGTEGAPKSMNRSEPVQFERAVAKRSEEADPYGIEDIVQSKKSRKN